MKKVMLAVFGFGLVSCGPVPQPVCTMSWTCGTASCAAHMGAWSGNGSFSGANDESDCLIWETAFLNSTGNPYNHVTACSCSN